MDLSLDPKIRAALTGIPLNLRPPHSKSPQEDARNARMQGGSPQARASLDTSDLMGEGTENFSGIEHLKQMRRSDAQRRPGENAQGLIVDDAPFE